MVIEGNVENIIYRNDDNGYTVIDFCADSKLITAVGIFPMLCNGEKLTLVGNFNNKGKYGEQFEVSDVTCNVPTDIYGITQYLSSGLFKGVGVAIAGAIVEMFGADTLKIIEESPEKLAKVKGISKNRAADIGQAYAEHIGMQHTIMFLQKHGVTIAQATKIYQHYGDRTEEVLLDNPYILVEDIEGIGFLTADRMAHKFGVELDSGFRIMAGIAHVLKEGASRDGHTAMPKDMVLSEAYSLLNMDRDADILQWLQPMFANLRLKQYTITSEDEDIVMLSLPIYMDTENKIASRLMRMINAVKEVEINLDEDLARYEKANGVELHSMQKQAISTAISNGVMVITGGPGTGKTTIIKCISELFMARKCKVVLAAPTGRAAKRMCEATGMEAKTIHRTLGMEYAGGKSQFKYNELEPLPADVVIVDEISMADIFIFNALIKALEVGTRIVLVGDKDQLASVAAGNILGDIIASNMLPVIGLTEIYRQDANSLIVSNAHRINNGQMPMLNNASKDFFIDDKSEYEQILSTVVAMYTQRLPQYFNIDPLEIQILTPIKKSICGVENLNKEIQAKVNHNSIKITHNNVTFIVGDKVMQISNNYDIAWTRNECGRVEEGKGVFNGDIGIITSIYKDRITVLFDENKSVVYEKKNYDELNLAYAISVHKSQGSEFKVVLLVLSGGYYGLLTRNLLYTAVTRAKEAVVIVGSSGVIARMVANKHTTKRFTLLKDMLVKSSARIAKITAF